MSIKYIRENWWYRFADDKDTNKKNCKSYMIDNNLQDTFILARDKPKWKDKYLKEYNAVINETHFKRLCKTDTHLYEILIHIIRCLYFDIDCYKKRPITEEEFVVVIDRLIGLINNELDVVLSYDDFAIKINNDYKVVGVKSFHLICKKYCMDFNQLKHLVGIINDTYRSTYIDEFDEDVECKLKDDLLDVGVYSKDRLIRCLGQSKRQAKDKKEDDYTFVLYNKLCKLPKRFGDTIIRDNKNARLIKYDKKHKPKLNIKIQTESDTSFKKNLITISTDKNSFINGFKKLDKRFWDTTNNWTCATRIIKKLDLLPMDEWNKFSIEMGTRDYEYDTNAEFIDTMDITLINSGYNKLTEVLNKCSDEYVFWFEYDKYFFMREQLVKYITHHKLDIVIPLLIDTKTPIVLTDDYEINYAIGFITDKSKKRRLPNNHNKVNFGTDLITIIDRFTKYPTTNIDNIEEISTYVDEFINNETLFFAVKSSWGTGKSRIVGMRIMNWIVSLENNTDTIMNVLLFTPLNSLACKLFDDLKALGYISHLNQDKKIRLSKCNKLICSPQSLVKARNTKFDWIFLDEMNMILNTYSGGFTFEKLCDPSPSYDILIKMCKNAKKIVMMDADIEEDLMELFISRINNTEVPKIVINSQNNYEDYKFNMIDDKEFFDERIEKCINDGCKIFISSTSQKQAREYYDGFCHQFPTKNILLIDRYGCSRSYNKKLPNKLKYIEELEVKIRQEDVDIFIYTPTICVGTSINKPFFHYGFAFGMHTPLIAQQFLQQLFRIRLLNAKNIDIYLPKRCWGNYEFNCSIETGRKKILLVEKKKKVFNSINYTYTQDEKYYDMLGYWNSKVINSEKCFGREVLKLMHHHNLNFEFIDPDDKPQEQTQLFVDGIVKTEQEQERMFLEAIPYDDYYEMQEIQTKISNKIETGGKISDVIDAYSEMRLFKTEVLYKMYGIRDVMKSIPNMNANENGKILVNGFINSTIDYKKSADKMLYHYWNVYLKKDKSRLKHLRKRFAEVRLFYERPEVRLEYQLIAKEDRHREHTNHDREMEDVLRFFIFEVLDMLDAMYVDITDEFIIKDKKILVGQFINIIFNNKTRIKELVSNYTEIELRPEAKRRCYEWITDFNIKSYYDKNDEHYIKIIYNLFNSRLEYLDLKLMKTTTHQLIKNKWLLLCKTNTIIRYKQDIKTYKTLNHLPNEHTQLFDVEVPIGYDDKQLNKTLSILDKTGRRKLEHITKFNIATEYLIGKHNTRDINGFNIVSGVDRNNYDVDIGVEWSNINKYNDDEVYSNNCINNINLKNTFKKSWYDNKKKLHRYKDENGVEWYRNNEEVVHYEVDTHNWVKDTALILYRPYKTMISDKVEKIKNNKQRIIHKPVDNSLDAYVDYLVNETIDEAVYAVWTNQLITNELQQRKIVPLMKPNYDEIAIKRLCIY